MKFLAAVLATTLLAPMVSDAAERTVVNEGNAAIDTYADCMADAVLRLDDHRSDATTVATAIRSVCSLEFESVKLVLGRSTTLDERRALFESLDQDAQGSAVAAVLRARRLVRRAAEAPRS